MAGVIIDWGSGLFLFFSRGQFSDFAFTFLFLMTAYFIYRQKYRGRIFGRSLFLWYLVVALVTATGILAVYYILWASGYGGCQICPYFLPPHSTYYFNEIMVRWLSSLAFNAAVGLIGGLCFLGFARLTGERIIDQLDVDLLTVGGMAVGWPNIMVFYGLVFVSTIFLTIARALVERSSRVRMIITPALPLAAATVVVFGDTLARWVGLYESGFTLVV